MQCMRRHLCRETGSTPRQAGRHQHAQPSGDVLAAAWPEHDQLWFFTSIMKSSDSSERACKSDLGAMRGHFGGGGPAGSEGWRRRRQQ